MHTALERLAGMDVAGFTTEEIRERTRRRLGFRAISIGRDRRVTIAHVDFRGSPPVGRYGVDVPAIDRLACEDLAPDRADLYVIDEIGRMECLSRSFLKAVRLLLESDRPLIATVALRGGGLIAEVKEHPGAEIWELTHENRNTIPGRIVAWVAGEDPGSWAVA